jgi:membrane protease YdiL (CAAX protease family)
MRPNGSTPERPFPLVAAIAVTAAGIAAMVGGSTALALRSGFGLRTQIAMGTLALALPAVAVLLLRPDLWPAVRGTRRVTGRLIGLSLLLGAALWIGSAGLMEVQSLLVPPTPEYLDAFRAIHRALAPNGPLDTLVSVLVIAVLPGVCEELVVRGVLLPSLDTSLRGGRGTWLAVLVSALLFAAIHLDAFRFLFTFALGLVFGFLRLRSGSLWPSVCAHASLNTLTFVVAPFVDDPTKPYTPSPALGGAFLLAGVAVAWPLLKALSGSGVDSPASRP